MNEKYTVLLSVCGAITGYFFGGADLMLCTFLTVLVIDTISGMIKSFHNGTYESKLFRKGLWQKTGYMLAVILAVQLDRLIGNTGALRSALLFCFIANEGTSIVENLGEMGVPIPPTIVNAIAVLRKRSDNSGQV